jgi:hypothetical protein
LAEQCHGQIPEQIKDSLDECNVHSIITNGKKDNNNALIGSAVRMMPKNSKNDENFVMDAEENMGWEKFRNRFLKRFLSNKKFFLLILY